MTTSVVHYVDRYRRIPCTREAYDEGVSRVLRKAATEWPEHVTCGGECAKSAKADLIIADRERVAWTRTRTVTAGPLGAEVRLNVSGGLALVYLDQVPTLLTVEDMDHLEALAARVRERANLLLARQRHRRRYAAPGAPPDPEHCQHHAARARGERFTCWTCGGEWPATPEGIAAAARESVTGRDA